MDEQRTNNETPADSDADLEAGEASGTREPQTSEPGPGPADSPEDAQASSAPDEADAGAGEDGIEEAPADGGDPAEALEAARAERDQWKDRHLRLAADFDNYRKRSEDRMRSRWDQAQADLAEQLLEPLDDLERLTGWDGEAPAGAEAVVEGAGLVGRKFWRILEEVGVSVVDPAGERFDPNTMEAMMRVAAESDEDDDKVERVFQKGYAFKGRLLRPARVSVYKAE